ncbi:MAG: hypothetical protein RR553_00690 [Akkermansia sp.]
MFGSPIKQVILTLVGVLLVGLMLWHLTTKRPIEFITPIQMNQSQEAMIPCLLTVRCAHTPNSLIIRQGTNILLKITDKESLTIEKEIDISQNKLNQGLSLIVETTWSAGTPETPITLSIEPNGMTTQTETRWSCDNSLHDIYHFSW